MKEFKVGQKVKITHWNIAEEWGLYKMFGDILTVENVRNQYGDCTTLHEGWFIPAEACELVSPN